ncbi:hypothetical protein BJX70DRAFT_401832 [Aspergillus crustosus]
MIPLVIGATIGMALCGSGTSVLGYYTPFMLLSSVLMPVFVGLITTFDTGTVFARHVLYTGFFGFACGVGYNAPISAVQAALGGQGRGEDVPVGIAVVLFAQQSGPAVFVAVAQVVFSSRMLKILEGVVSGIHVKGVEESGLLEIARGVPVESRGVVLEGVGRGFVHSWYSVALAGVGMVGSLGMEWRSVKEKDA